MVGVGSASVLSRAIGKKDQATVDKIMGNLIMMIAVCSLIITVIGTVFTRQILLLSGASGETLSLAVKYLRIVFLGSVFVNFSQAANMVMRGEGLLKRAMTIMGIGAVLNIVLDPILISLLNPLGMGIEAAAYATIFSQFVQAAITLWYFVKKSKNVRICKIRFERTLVPEIVGVGISAMLMQVTTLLQQTVLYNVAANYGGDTWQTLLGVALRIQSFAFIPVWGISQGFQPAAGTNYGAKQYDRVKTLAKVFMIGATLVSLLFYIPIELAPKAVMSLFITDPAIVDQGVANFRIFFSSYILQGYDTKVGESGGQLSGGERQRIAIARAMMKNAPIIILDEATAYADVENEAIMQEAIAKLIIGKTLLVIAHRLSTITDADNIVVVENGKIAAQGQHSYLLKNCDLYRKMWAANQEAADEKEAVL